MRIKSIFTCILLLLSITVTEALPASANLFTYNSFQSPDVPFRDGHVGVNLYMGSRINCEVKAFAFNGFCYFGYKIEIVGKSKQPVRFELRDQNAQVVFAKQVSNGDFGHRIETNFEFIAKNMPVLSAYFVDNLGRDFISYGRNQIPTYLSRQELVKNEASVYPKKISPSFSLWQSMAEMQGPRWMINAWTWKDVIPKNLKTTGTISLQLDVDNNGQPDYFIALSSNAGKLDNLVASSVVNIKTKKPLSTRTCDAKTLAWGNRLLFSFNEGCMPLKPTFGYRIQSYEKKYKATDYLPDVGFQQLNRTIGSDVEPFYSALRATQGKDYFSPTVYFYEISPRKLQVIIEDPVGKGSFGVSQNTTILLDSEFTYSGYITPETDTDPNLKMVGGTFVLIFEINLRSGYNRIQVENNFDEIGFFEIYK